VSRNGAASKLATRDIVSNMHDMKHGAKRKRRAVLVQSFLLTHPGTRHTVLLEYF
jgi:hypothetical protein